MATFRFDCEYCHQQLESNGFDAVEDAATAHLEDNHDEELTDVFSVAFSGRDCRNDCGYSFPNRVEEVAGSVCPACGHDNFPAFVRQYVYWRVERA